MLFRGARTTRTLTCAGVFLWVLCAVPHTLQAAGMLPSLDEFLDDLGLPAADKPRVLAGELVNFTPPSTDERELAVGMVFLVQAPPETLVQRFFDKVAGLNPDIIAHGQITGDGTVEQFADLALAPNGDDEARKFLDAKPGNDLNLSTDEITTFNALKSAGRTSKADVEVQLRKMLLARYQAYRAKGLAGLAPYARHGEERDIAAELRVANKNSQYIVEKYLPGVYAMLGSYPQDVPANTSDRLFWLNIKIDDRPTLILSHRPAVSVENGYFLMQRHFYVSRSYNAEQELGGLLNADKGTVVFYANRTFTDQVGGFGSSAKRKIGQGLMGKQIGAMWKKLQQEEPAK